jgi:spermidine/putrescine transport system ATP-binding protein
MSDRIAVMDDGKVRQIADPATLYELPADRFVAGFIGETNTFSGEVVDTDKNRTIIRTADGMDIEAFVPDGREVSKGEEAHAAVRPEKVRLGGEGDNVVSGRIRDVVYLGSSTQYIVEIESGERISLVKQNIRDASGEKEGDEATVAWDAENCLILGD